MFPDSHEVLFFTALAFGPYLLTALGIGAFWLSHRWWLPVTLLLGVPSAAWLIFVFRNVAGLDAQLFWILPLTANLILAYVHWNRWRRTA